MINNKIEWNHIFDVDIKITVKCVKRVTSFKYANVVSLIKSKKYEGRKH